MNVVLFLLFFSTTFVAALFLGGAPERWTALMLISAIALSYLFYSSASSRFHLLETYVALVDLALLAGITIILLRADRFWPIALFAVHGVTVLAHLVKYLDVFIMRQAYAIATNAPSWAVVAILLVAVLRHRTRLRLSGRDLDWSVGADPKP